MVKEVKDYVQKVQEKYPYLTDAQISKILIFGLRRYAWAIRMHCDIQLSNRIDDVMSIYTNYSREDRLKNFRIWLTKYRMKERAIYRMKKKIWDGYYYIGLNQEDHDIIKKQGKLKHFKHIYMTKVKRELFHYKIVKHIWRVPWPIDCGWKFFLEKYDTKHAEYVGPNRFDLYQDCYNNKYNYGTGD